MDPSRETHPQTPPGLAGISYRGSRGSGTAPRPRAQHRACWPFLQGPPQDEAREGASVKQLGAGAGCCPGPVGRCPEAAQLLAPLECPGARPPGGSPAPRAPRVPRGKPSWGQPCSATCLRGAGQWLAVPASSLPGSPPETPQSPLFSSKPFTWLLFFSQSAWASVRHSPTRNQSHRWPNPLLAPWLWT